MDSGTAMQENYEIMMKHWFLKPLVRQVTP